MGESGVGKSTLLNLIADGYTGFGRNHIDGVPIMLWPMASAG